MSRLSLCFTLLLTTLLTAAERPNILFCISDDQSYPHASVYGTKWVSTPAFDRVAKQGLLFTECYTPNAKCAPSRACVLTGRNSWQLGPAANHWPVFPADTKVYTEVLAEHGYHVGSTGKGWAPGIAKTKEGKPRHLAGQPYRKRTAKPPAKAISNNDYAGNFADFLNAKPDDAPFCFWYGATEPHRAYEYQAGIKYGGKKLTDVDRVPTFWPDNETIRTDILDYAFEIEHFDKHLGRMLDDLQKRGLLENTLVVVTADNGMPFPRVKGQKYELSNHLPLAIMWPAGIESPGRTVSDLVSFIDFAPTFLQAAGIDWEASGLAPTPGKPLQAIFGSVAGDALAMHHEHVLLGKERHDIGRPHDWGYPVRGIRKGDYLFLKNYEPTRWPAGNPETGYLNTDGSPTKTVVLDLRRSGVNGTYWEQNFGKRPEVELYNVEADPFCLINLADSEELKELRESLEREMTAALKAEGDQRLLGKPDYYESFPYADKNGRGFYERFMRGEKVRAGWVNPTDFEQDFSR